MHYKMFQYTFKQTLRKTDLTLFLAVPGGELTQYFGILLCYIYIHSTLKEKQQRAMCRK